MTPRLWLYGLYWDFGLRRFCNRQVLQNLNELYPRIKEVNPNHIYTLEMALKYIDTMTATDNVLKMKALCEELLQNMRSMPMRKI